MTITSTVMWTSQRGRTALMHLYSVIGDCSGSEFTTTTKDDDFVVAVGKEKINVLDVSVSYPSKEAHVDAPEVNLM
ncbi:hypothetical protein BLNAU_21682 [Blattamonas nauphoetae]|uniref:Uncharacterized protein n=1 Tax=Blattamonas nauphoetae TaxID=2049346 RepID=A0ABQ9WV51_9EUKA|nr:hypothetical protein BLNAU_21682 [Blattamonas nauphoetae]